MIKVINLSLKLNRLWQNGTRNIVELPQYKELLKELPLPFQTKHILSRFPKKISIKTFYVQSGLRISLYMIPAGRVMQAHDHPDMFVLGHIMQGKALVSLYNKVQGNLYEKTDKVVQRHDNLIIDGNQPNVHSVKAIENTMLFDILFPDYDDARPGNMYVQTGKQGQLVMLEEDQNPDIEMQEVP